MHGGKIVNDVKPTGFALSQGSEGGAAWSKTGMNKEDVWQRAVAATVVRNCVLPCMV
ncbi:hypothetical protein MASSI9I_50581 [Massilia sp. 9I]|nr:hypothetical protein MASSI9I_50581 [Massilia sp. 9I]